MTLEAWIYPTTVNNQWRDVLYKGNDDYFLMATTHDIDATRRCRHLRGGTESGRRNGQRSRQHLDASGDDV